MNLSKANDEDIEEEQQVLVISAELVGKRLDHVLSESYPRLSRTVFQNLIDEGAVLVSNRSEKKRYHVRLNDQITFTLPEGEALELHPEAIPLSILYEDDAIIVVNKQPGLVVHPGCGNQTGTFVNGLLHHLGRIQHEDPVRPGIVHRLDKDTSGVLIAAKNSYAHAALSAQFANRTVEKWYTALVRGRIDNPITIDCPIGRDPYNRLKMAVIESGRPAVSIVTPLQQFNRATLVDVQILTGRTHQIRVHLQHRGFPILGDSLYGGKIESSSLQILVRRQMLHCRMMAIQHPENNKLMEFEAPLFSDMQQLLLQLKT